MFAAALVLQAPAAAHPAEVLDEQACRQVTDEIPLIRRVDNEPYLGAVIYARTVELKEGQKALVLSELQAINDRDELIMLGTFLTVSPEPFAEGAFRISKSRPARVSPALGENIDTERHYGVVSRHGIYTAPETATYHFGLVAYSASSLISEESYLPIQSDSCSLDVIALD